MIRNLVVAAGIALGGLLAVGQSASAAPFTPINQGSWGQSQVQQVQYNYCRRWNRECRARWGGGWKYRRCMRIHGC